MPKEGAGKKPVGTEAKKEKKPKQTKESGEGGDDEDVSLFAFWTRFTNILFVEETQEETIKLLCLLHLQSPQTSSPWYWYL